MAIRGVIFDWRGTLVTTLTEQQWVQEALVLLGRHVDPETVEAAVTAITQADGPDNRLDPPGIDTDAALHRQTFLNVLGETGLDQQLIHALYTVESDYRHNPFAEDAKPVLTALHGAGIRLAVLSDIHFDLRPAFDAAGMHNLIDAFILSFEQRRQKPDPALFRQALARLGTQPHETLMVGDRARPDGPAVEQDIPTLLLPPLEHTRQRRLNHVLALAGIPVHGPPAMPRRPRPTLRTPQER